MRYFVISTSGDNPENIGVVFHDYVSGYFLCRSRKRSFYEAFNAVSSRIQAVLVKVGGAVVIRPFGANDFSWIDRVLFEACGSYWRIDHEGSVSSSESSVDGIVRKYIQE